MKALIDRERERENDLNLFEKEMSVLMVLCVTLVAGLCRAMKSVVNIPIVAVVVALGFGAGFLVSKYDVKETLLPVTDNHVQELLFLYMPTMVFTAAFSLRYHLFWQCFYQCSLMGVAGLGFSTMLYVLYMFGTQDQEKKNRTSRELFLISLVTCSPEPMFSSDVNILSSARSHILETIIMGEPLIGVTVVWSAFHLMYLRNALTPYEFCMNLLCTLTVGPILGKLVGHLLAFLLITLSQDLPICFVVSLVTVFGTWAFSETFLYGAGVTTIISLALTTNASSASTILNPVVLRKFWMLLRFGFNVIIVFITSYKIGRDTRPYLSSKDMMSPINAYVAKIGVRFITTIVLYPALATVGYDLTWQQCLIVAWANFKGALMIGLRLSKTFPNLDLVFALKEEFVRLGTLFLVQLLNTTTLPKLMSMLGLTTLSDVEKANMNMVILALRNTARSSINFQRRDKKFSGADWKWIQIHTYIENPYAGAEEEEHVYEHTDTYVPARVYRNAAARKASSSILRLQKVCYNKQYESGMIHKKTKTTILAALQYPMEKETYLNYQMMQPYITLPEWIYKLKLLVQKFAGFEAIEKRRCISRSHFEDDEEEIPEPMHLLCAMVKEGWYHVLVGFVALGFSLLLAGMAIYLDQSRSGRGYTMSLIVTIQGIYVLIYSLEMVLTVYTYSGTLRVGKDAWKQVDVTLFLLVVIEFVLISLVTIQTTKPSRAYALFLQISFITLIACRTIKTLQKRVVMFLWVLDLLDGVLNRKLFYAYDLSWAYITAEDEAMAKVFRFVPTPLLALMIRENSGYNKLQTLKNVVDIQQRYPNIEVSTKTRQAARRILNKALDGLKELHEGGLLDDKQYSLLYGNLTWMIQKADGMPTNIIVGNAPLCTMLSVPWLTRDVVPSLLRSFYQFFEEGKALVERDQMHQSVHIICSGIVRVSGINEEPWNRSGHLKNSDSTHYYFSEGPFQDYLVAPETLGLLGFLTGKHCVSDAYCETDVEMCCIPMNVMTTLVEQHPEPPSLVYRMWFSIAIRIGLAVLLNQKCYQEWSHDKLKRFLESGIMPNLYYAIDFSLDDAVQDVILVQGLVQCVKTQETFTGPTYIPPTVRDMFLPGNPLERPRPIMLITTMMRYHLPTELDWMHQSLRHYDYIRKSRNTLSNTE
ncbi:sperm-specific sodium:proton exchanger-like [Ornithodoros turicata]|uniref:sperm-specific sodium:proton exchanger-like n=1 Tax=Ornithodoros turicata TaxID=34597 RepID=UPI003138F449